MGFFSGVPKTAVLLMTAVTDPAVNAAVTTALVDTYAGVIVTLTAAGNAQTIQNPSSVVAGKTYTVVNNDTSNNTLTVNGITLPIGKAQTWIWDGTAWVEIDIGITTIPVPITQGGTGNIYGMAPGNQEKHGFVNRTDSTLVWTNTTPDRTLTITGTYTYYYQGMAITKLAASPVATQITNTIGLWFIYFNSVGVLTANQNFPAFETSVLVAMVWWNGTTGIVMDERHGYRRNLDWHLWAHDTIGLRYENDGGLALTAAGTGAAATFSTTHGHLFDEDVEHVIPASSAFTLANAGRIWYQSAAAAFSLVTAPSTIPFYWNSGTSRVRYVNAAGPYALADADSTKYVNVWVYGTNDINQPISFVIETIATATGGHNTVVAARNITPPALVGMGLAPEMKLLYRLVVKGDGTVQSGVTADDYRTSSPVPGGGIVLPVASSVVYSPNNLLTTTNVQAAIDELQFRTPGVKDTGYTILWAGLGTVPKIFTCDSASDQVFDFAAPAAIDVGKMFTIVKLGAGKVTIDAPATIYIEDSADGGTLYCSDTGVATVTLLLATATKLVIVSATNTWTTT